MGRLSVGWPDVGCVRLGVDLASMGTTVIGGGVFLPLGQLRTLVFIELAEILLELDACRDAFGCEQLATRSGPLLIWIV